MITMNFVLVFMIVILSLFLITCIKALLYDTFISNISKKALNIRTNSKITIKKKK